jgi:hypothetical protein
MAKLFLFAIGGTGSRVLKALTMLLASGVRLENTDAVIPIVLDPHTTNDDLLRTRDLLREYTNVRAALTTKPTDGFFGTEISTLSRSIGPNAKVADTYVFDLQGVGKTQFKDYINFGGLDPANKAFAGLLFSDDNLNTTMDIGFVGNPNIGSTVLNQFKNSAVFQAFAEHFGAGDRVFIVSSIFGGTGAAGFPILLKNIRGAQMAGLANPAFLRDAAVGALTVGPYFSLSTGGTDTRIDGAAFIAKTKAALGYYEKNVNPAVNVMYAIADRQTRAYEYDPGDNGQPNDAHFVELASAMAIVDFMATSAPNLTTVNGQPSDPILKEFGIADETLPIRLDRLAEETKRRWLCSARISSSGSGRRLGPSNGPNRHRPSGRRFWGRRFWPACRSSMAVSAPGCWRWAATTGPSRRFCSMPATWRRPWWAWSRKRKL